MGLFCVETLLTCFNQKFTFFKIQDTTFKDVFMSIKIFNWDIPLYGLLFYTGVAFAALVAVLICRKKKIELFDMVCSAIYTMIGAIVGAKLLFLAVTLPEIIEMFKIYPAEDVLFSIIKGGFVFYGGLIGGALGLLIYVKQFKLKLEPFVEVFAVVVPLGHAFGRVGCFFAGCCYGMEYHGPLSYTYTVTAGSTPLGVPLLPIQLIETTCLLILFGALMIAFFKSKGRPFLCTKIYAIGYAAIRFTLEFFRGDKERGVALFSTSQWISIGIVVLVTTLWIIGAKRKKKAILAEGEAAEGTEASEIAESTEETEKAEETEETEAVETTTKGQEIK